MTAGISSCNNQRECSSRPSHLNKSGDKKQVTFSLQQTAYFSNSQQQQELEQHERKSLCWYSEAELNSSRDDARHAIEALQERPEELLSIRYDATDGFCLRGLEKYADAAAKFAGQKRLVCSVLQQQSINNKMDHVALVSRTLSQPFKDVARYYAVKSAEEAAADEESNVGKEVQKRKENEASADLAQQQEVATVLLWFVDAATHSGASSSLPVPTSPSCSSSRTTGRELMKEVQREQQEEQSLDTPPEMLSKKRSYAGSSTAEAGDHPPSSSFQQGEESLLLRRNVKPCVRVITE
jgi:hypothetical protein